MDELQRPAGLEHPCGRQQLGCLGCPELVEARESPRLEKVALLEHSQRPSEPPGMLGKSTKPEANRPADRSCADSFDVAGGLRGRTDTSFAQRLHEHVQEERRPSRRPQAGIDEDGIRRPTQPRFQELLNGRSCQRRDTDNLGRGIGRQRRKQLGVGLCLAARDDKRDVQFLEAREEESQVTQGRGVCPVHVVDDQAEGTLGGQIRAQPVEPVQDRERSINARRGLIVSRGCAGKPEQAGRHAGGGLQQIGPLELRCLGQRRLEKLPHDTEGEIALQLRPPRPQHAHAAVCRLGPRRSEQRSLADPGRPLDHRERALARAGRGKH